MTKLLLSAFFIFVYSLGGFAQYVDYWTPQTINVCEGDTFSLFGNQQPFNKFKSVYDENCAPHAVTNEPNWEEFVVSGGNKIAQKDTLYQNVCGDPCSYAVIYYIKFKASQSTTITISTTLRSENEYGSPKCNPANNPPVVTYTRIFTYNIVVYPKNPKPTIKAQTITTYPNAPETIMLTAEGCDTDQTIWSSTRWSPFIALGNVVSVDKPYECDEYIVSCRNRFCPNFAPNWSDSKSSSDFQHNQNNPGYSPTFSEYLNNQANKSIGKPEYTYRRQFACIQQKSKAEYDRAGENGWAGGFIKHLFNDFAKKKSCDLSANYTCKYATTQIGCLREAGNLIHGLFELGPGFFSYNPSGSIPEGIASWNAQHDGFLTNAVATCFDELKQDPNFYNTNNPTDNLAAIDAMESYVVTLAIWSRWAAQIFYVPRSVFSLIRRSANQFIPVDIQDQLYADLPTALTRDQLFSQQVFDASQIKVTAQNTYFLKTNSSVQLNIQPAQSTNTTYQLSVDPSIATIDANGLLTIHSTTEPLFNGRLPFYVIATNNGQTGIGQFAIYDTDSDGDMIADTYEQRVGLNPAVKNDLKSDIDGDDLLDFFEVCLGSDPLKRDTDGDGFTDLEEYQKSTIPTLALSYPNPSQISSISSGDWHATATWSCNCIPTRFEQVTVNPEHIVTVSLGNAETGRLNNSGSLQFAIPNGQLYILPQK